MKIINYFPHRLLIATLLLSAGTVSSAKGGIGAVFGALIGGAVGKVAGKSLAEPQSVERALVAMTNQINKQTPMMVDRDTRWDNTTPGPGGRFTYNYTFVTATSREIDQNLFPKFFSTLKAGVCSNSDMQIFFKHGVTIGYSYRASDGVFVSKFDITPKECGYGA